MHVIQRAVCVSALAAFTWAPVAGPPACLGAEKLPYGFLLIGKFVGPIDDVGPGFEISVAFSKNGRHVVCTTGSKSESEPCCYLWDVQTGEHKGVLAGSEEPAEVCLGTYPYGRYATWTVAGLEVQDGLSAPGKKTLIRLEDLQPGVLKDGWVYFPIKGEGSFRMGTVIFSADGEYLAAFRFDKSIHVWNVRRGEHVGRFVVPGIPTLPSEQDPAMGVVRSVAFDPTNRYLAVGVDNGALLVVWDLKTGRETHRSREKLRPFSVAFLPNGDLLCGEYGAVPGRIIPGLITVRKAGTFEEIRTIEVPEGGVMSIAVVPGVEVGRTVSCKGGEVSIAVVRGTGVVSGGTHGHVSLWDIATGKRLAMARECGDDDEYGESVNSVAVGGDGKLIAAGGCTGYGGQGEAWLWKIVPAQ
jgi:WD40 repeat protein